MDVTGAIMAQLHMTDPERVDVKFPATDFMFVSFLRFNVITRIHYEKVVDMPKNCIFLK